MTQARPGTPKAKQQQEEGPSDHGSEGPENDRGVRPVLRGEILQPANLIVPAVGEDEAAQMRNLQSVTCGLGSHVGPTEQGERHTLAWLVLPMTLDRGDFRGLMLKAV